MQINSFKDFAILLQSSKLNNAQVFTVVQHSMGLILSKEQLNLERKILVEKLTNHYTKYNSKGGWCRPLFLELDLSVK